MQRINIRRYGLFFSIDIISSTVVAMRVGLVPFAFAGAVSAAALPGGWDGGSCFTIKSVQGWSYGSFHYNEAAGTVTDGLGYSCGWGQGVQKLSCGRSVQG